GRAHPIPLALGNGPGYDETFSASTDRAKQRTDENLVAGDGRQRLSPQFGLALGNVPEGLGGTQTICCLLCHHGTTCSRRQPKPPSRIPIMTEHQGLPAPFPAIGNRAVLTTPTGTQSMEDQSRRR